MQKRGLFIFRRDLRLDDNTGLIAAQAGHEEVLPVFFFNPQQLGPHPYRSVSGLQFLLESLKDLELQIASRGGKLLYCNGSSEDRLLEMVKKYSIASVYFNRDYTPYSKVRDEKIVADCSMLGIPAQAYDDLLLKSPGEVLKPDGKSYTIYTPFSKNALKQKMREPLKNVHNNFVTPQQIDPEIDLPAIYKQYLPVANPKLYQPGGRRTALDIVDKLQDFSSYATERDFPALKSTTGLSAHHKFGTVSVREVFKKVVASFGLDHSLIRELLWRDFFSHIAFYYPHVFSGAFYRRYDSLIWDEAGERFAAWTSGMTGFPLVDAGMRELQSTGFMQNRVRMVVASFLTKDLHISWREGEKYFAQHLVDYDPAVNNGNWQWAASTGCDAQPYFRIFNPWLQQERFDSNCEYIKRWIPELAALSPKEIHGLAKSGKPPTGYPTPIVDHSIEKIITEKRYATAAALTKKQV